MTTESASLRYRGLDTWGSLDILDALIEGQMAAVAAVRTALPALEAAASAAAERLRLGGRLVYTGAGTSGRLAVQDGVELTPTFNWPSDRVVFVIAGGDAALTSAIEGAEDDARTAAAAIDARNIGCEDVVIGVAASGTTAYTVAALRRARVAGALTVGLANNPETPLLRAAEHAVLLDTGPEVIAGSTRMKAGTAQRSALTLFSTLVMIRLGRVYDGYMVDVRANSRKLVERSERMLMQITGADAQSVRGALTQCGGQVKPAALVLRGLSPEAARAALETASGDLRSALELMTPAKIAS